jgi:hypothetical protein
MYLNPLLHDPAIKYAAVLVAGEVWLRVHVDAVIGLLIVHALGRLALVYQLLVALPRFLVASNAAWKGVGQISNPLCPDSLMMDVTTHQKQ